MVTRFHLVTVPGSNASQQAVDEDVLRRKRRSTAWKKSMAAILFGTEVYGRSICVARRSGLPMPREPAYADKRSQDGEGALGMDE